MKNQNNKLENMNVLITGGTSGLGKATAIELLDLGANVAILARGKKGLDETLEISDKFITVQGDISNKKAIYEISGEVEARLGPVDILINAASTLGETPLRPLMDTSCEVFAEVLETNLIGPFRLIKALASSMIIRRQGLVVNISSDAAVSAYPEWGAYSVSKAALDHLTRIFNEELSEFEVKFRAVDPGDMNTPMHHAAVPDANPADLRDPKDSANRLIELIKKSLSQNSANSVDVRSQL